MPGPDAFPSPVSPIPAFGTAALPRLKRPDSFPAVSGAGRPLSAIEATCRRLARIADCIDIQAKYTAEIAARARGATRDVQAIIDELRARHG